MTTTQTPPLEDDVKVIRETLANVPKMSWRITSWNVIIPETEEDNSEGLINFAAIFNKLVGKKFARYVAACSPARIARLLAHIDAQAEAHASELRRVRDVRNENAEDARREIASLRELMNAQAVRLDAAERLAADRLEQMNADRKQALVWRDQAELYEQVRKFSPREFQALWTKNVTSGAMFDDLVRAAIKEAKT